MNALKTLTNDHIISLAPAAGSLEPIHGVSSRYSFVPTLTAVDLLREAGWFPIHAEQSTVRKVEREGYQRHLIRFAKNGLAFDGERVDEMKVIEMSPDERGVFAQAAHSLIYDESEQAPVQPNQLLDERRYDDKGNDLWKTFNVIQENVMRGGLKGTTRDGDGRLRRTTTRPVKALDRNIKLNQALWFLTENMAELKQADTNIPPVAA